MQAKRTLAFPESIALPNFFPQDEKVEDRRPAEAAVSSAGCDVGPAPLGRDFSSQICSSKPERVKVFRNKKKNEKVSEGDSFMTLQIDT